MKFGKKGSKKINKREKMRKRVKKKSFGSSPATALRYKAVVKNLGCVLVGKASTDYRHNYLLSKNMGKLTANSSSIRP